MSGSIAYYRDQEFGGTALYIHRPNFSQIVYHWEYQGRKIEDTAAK
jgi:hypothetical protein